MPTPPTNHEAKVVSLAARPVEDRPPMCQAITALRVANGMSNNEMARRLGVSQGAAWKWETSREPGYQEVGEIEKVLELSPGTLFAAAGYTPTQDAVHAVELDPALTDEQKRRVIAAVVKARGSRRAIGDHIDSEHFVYADQSIPADDRIAIARMIAAAKYENRLNTKKARRRG